MAYECPVCEVLAPDGEHLAHHLAIVAMTRGGDHEAWLDDHAEGWADSEPADLAAVATEHAAEVDHDLLDAHGAGDRDGGRPDVSPPGPGAHAPAAGSPESPLDGETAAILREARELTARIEDHGSDDEPADEPDAESDGTGPTDTEPDDTDLETDTDE